MAFNTLNLGRTFRELLKDLNENFAATVGTWLLGQPSGVATLDSSGRVPLDQLNLDALDSTVVLLGITDTAPTATAVGDKYFNTATSKIYTWDGSTWGGAVTPSKDVFYLSGDIWFKWNGTAMVPLADIPQSGAQAFPFTAADSGWTENLVDGTHSLQIAVDTEGGGAVCVDVTSAAGESLFVDTAIGITGGVTFLTVTASEVFTGTAYIIPV